MHMEMIELCMCARRYEKEGNGTSNVGCEPSSTLKSRGSMHGQYSQLSSGQGNAHATETDGASAQLRRYVNQGHAGTKNLSTATPARASEEHIMGKQTNGNTRGAAHGCTAAAARAPRTVAARALTAAVAVIALVVACIVPSVLPNIASAAPAAQSNLSAGAITTPLDISIGANINQPSAAGPDTGVATWVGRDLYVGAPPAYQSAPYTYTNSDSPAGSYTAEVEGLTIVKGKFANHKLGNSWGGNGLRMGAVGFGTMFRPANGAQALGVAGTNTNITSMTTGPDTTVFGNVGAWAHGAFVGKGNTSNTAQFTAAIAGATTYWNTSTAANPRASVVQTAGTFSAEPGVTFNATNPLTANGTDFSDYNNQTVIPLSNKLAASASYTLNESAGAFTTAPANAKPGVYVGYAPDGDYTRNHYSNSSIQHQWHFSGAHRERLITFNGDGTSLLQSFTIDASELTSANSSGLDFAFTNIPDNAAVAITVAGSAPVTFQNGWRFWWNGAEVGNGYASCATAEQKKDYNIAAQAIMWNFANTSKLTVYGGSYGTSTTSEPADTAKTGTALPQPGDDPAAAMLGSIIVPRGSFDDHVITNGRVYVGGDLMLDSPVYVGTYNNAESASIIGMDQERHNYPWRGMQPASLISWSKANAGTGALLKGSSWEVFGTIRDALSGTNPILTVKDNSAIDINKTDGVFEVGLLKPDATYYLREVDPPTGFRLNDNIYQINTGAASDTPYTAIANVYSSDTSLALSGAARLLVDTTADGAPSPAIGDRPYGGTVNWGKSAQGDASHTGLPGSQWTLTNATNPNAEKTWTIDDNTTAVESLRILDANGNALPNNAATMQAGGTLTLTAQALPAGAPQQVTWSVSPTDVVGVQNGVVTSYGQLKEAKTVTVTATTVDTTHDGRHLSASVTLTVTPAAVTGLNILYNGATVPASISADVAQGSLQFAASTTPTGSAVTWTSSDNSVASVQNGVVTLKAAGTTTITAKSGTITKTVTITVTNHNLVIFVNTTTTGINYLPFLAWKTSAQATYTFTLMAQYCDGWYRAVVPSKNAAVQFYFQSANGATYMGPGGKTPFTAGAGTRSIAVYKYDDIQPGVTPTCAAPAKSTTAAKSAGAAADIRDSGLFARNSAKRTVRAATTDPNAPTYTDSNTQVGQFTLKNLPAGTYTLQEKTPPSGYLLNPAVYKFTVDANGVVTWVGEQPSIVDGTGWISDTPSSVAWKKYDSGYADSSETKTPLAGSAWTIERKGADGAWSVVNAVADCEHEPCDASVTYKDSDPDPGAFLVNNLPLGTYRIVETTVPAGYEKVGGPYEFTLDDSTRTTVQVGGGSIANRRKTGSVTWSKTSVAEPNKLLAGSAWSITFTPKGSTTPQTYTITDCEGGGDCTVSGNPAWAKDADTTAGTFTLTGLEWGTYTLHETKAPAGYDLAPGTHTFRVGPGTDGTVVLDWELGAIQDEPGVVLPATGGTGDARRMILTGLALMAFAMAGCALAIRKRGTDLRG